MAKVTFRGATLRHFDGRFDEDAGAVFYRLHLAADYSDPVRDAMGWSSLPEGFQSAKVSGRIEASWMAVTPASKQLQNHAWELRINEVTDFQVVRPSEGMDELRFVVRTSELVAGVLEKHLSILGRESCRIDVSYEVQGKLDLGDGDKVRRAVHAAKANGANAGAGEE